MADFGGAMKFLQQLLLGRGGQQQQTPPWMTPGVNPNLPHPTQQGGGMPGGGMGLPGPQNPGMGAPGGGMQMPQMQQPNLLEGILQLVLAKGTGAGAGGAGFGQQMQLGREQKYNQELQNYKLMLEQQQMAAQESTRREQLRQGEDRMGLERMQMDKAERERKERLDIAEQNAIESSLSRLRDDIRQTVTGLGQWTPEEAEEVALSTARASGKNLTDQQISDLGKYAKTLKPKPKDPREYSLEDQDIFSWYSDRIGKSAASLTGSERTKAKLEHTRMQSMARAEASKKEPDPNIDGLVNAVMANPALFPQLPSTQKALVTPKLHALGFKEFGKPLSDTAIAQISNTKTAHDGLAELRTIISSNQKSVGPISGLAALNPWAESRKIQADIDRVRQRVGKALEGGVLRKEDEEKYKKILATITDEPSTALYKIDQLLKDLDRDLANFTEGQMLGGRNVPQQQGGARNPLGLTPPR